MCGLCEGPRGNEASVTEGADAATRDDVLMIRRAQEDAWRICALQRRLLEPRVEPGLENAAGADDCTEVIRVAAGLEYGEARGLGAW